MPSRRNKLAPTISPIENNPVGWSSIYAPDVVRNPTQSVRQASNVWLPGAERPLFVDELEAARAASINLFNSLANVAPQGPSLPSVRVASRLGSAHNVPSLPTRPLAADYPNGAPFNAAGRLTHDIDGRPLTAPFVAGRSAVGSGGGVPDRGFDPSTVIRVGEEAGGAQFLVRPEPQIARGGDGHLRLRPGQPPEIAVSAKLSPGLQDNTRAHEVGHLIDELAGRIDTKGLSRELEPLYNRLLTGEARTRNLTRPQDAGYSATEAPRELMAEALRTYMTDPNTLKTLAPKTAARIRAAVNSHPLLSRWVQFNALAPAGVVGIGQDVLRREGSNGH